MSHRLLPSSLTTRLFAAVLATAVAVAVAMGVSAHVNLNRDFLGYLNEQAEGRLDLAVVSVTAGYRDNGSWDFLRQRPDGWFRLLRPRPADGTPATAGPAATPAELTGASRRFTLLDENRQRLAGFAAPAADAIERPIVVDGLTVGWLVMTPFESVSSGAEKRFADAQVRAAWAVGLGALAVAAALAFWASRRLLRPLRQVADATHRLAAGDYAVRVPERGSHGDVRRLGHDEVRQLAHDFNQLAAALQRTEAMRRGFMADVSHELRTPLAVLHGELEALEDGLRPLGPASLRALRGEVATLGKLVDDLYELSLADVGALAYRKAELDLRGLIGDTAGAFGERLRGRGIALELDLPAEPLPAFGDERRLRQLFVNLFENSCRYTDRGGAVRLRARRDGDDALVDLHDSAPGVAPELLPRLFERFFRAEASRSRAGGGAGLGLSICQRIVEAHEGRIEARPSPLGGLWLQVRLPAC